MQIYLLQNFQSILTVPAARSTDVWPRLASFPRIAAPVRSPLLPRRSIVLSESESKIVQLFLRVPLAERARVLDVIRAIRLTPAYVREREDCLRRLGLR